MADDIFYDYRVGNSPPRKIINTVVNLLNYIPENLRAGILAHTSTTNIGSYIQEVTDYLYNLGGGEILIPRGTYIVQGVVPKEKVSYRGEGQGATILKLPTSPSADMFKAASADIFFKGGGFYGLELDGGNTSTYNAIDFSAVSALETCPVYDCYIHDFHIGYRGSGSAGLGNDRFPVLTNTRFWTNDIGLYIQEHTHVLYCDVRANEVGIAGRLNDAQFVGVRINYNTIGVDYDDTAAPANTVFNACTFYKNTEIGLSLGNHNSVLGCYFVGVGSGSTGILCRGTGNHIIGNRFGLIGANNSFGDGAIRFGAGVVSTFDFYQIVANEFMLLDGPGITIGSTLTTRLLRIADNTFYVTSVQAIAFTNSGGNAGLMIKGNTIHFAGTLSGDLVEVTHPSTGYLIEGNAIFNEGGAITVAFGGSMASGTMCRNNRYRSTGTGAFTDATTDSTTRFSGNYGYVTEANGTATVANGQTSVTVTHGLAKTPAAKDVTLTPTNDLGNAAKFWISDVGATTFQINVNADPGAGTATFAWSAAVL